MADKRERKIVSKQDIINAATYKAIDVLRHKYGIGVDAPIFSNYIDSGRLKKFIKDVENSPKVKNLAYNAKMNVLSNMIEDYIITAMPFKQRARDVFFGGLEASVSKPSFFQRIFPKSKRAIEKRNKKSLKEMTQYFSNLEAIEGLKYNIGKNPKFYSKNMPDLVNMLGEAEEKMEYSRLAETLYLADKTSDNTKLKDYFEKAKAKFVGYAGNVVSLAKEKLSNYISGKDTVSKSYKAPKMESYIPNAALGAILGIFGIGLIAVSGLRLTGNVVGVFTRFDSGLIGILFLLIAFGLFLRRK